MASVNTCFCVNRRVIRYDITKKITLLFYEPVTVRNNNFHLTRSSKKFFPRFVNNSGFTHSPSVQRLTTYFPHAVYGRQENL